MRCTTLNFITLRRNRGYAFLFFVLVTASFFFVPPVAMLPTWTYSLITKLFYLKKINPLASIGLRTAKELFVEFGLIFAIAVYLIKNRWLRAGLIWVAICTIVNYNKWSFITLHLTTLYMVGYCILTAKDGWVEIAYDAIRVSVIIHLIWMTMQLCGFDPIFTSTPQMVGFLDNPVLMSPYLAVTLPLFFKGKWRWVIPVIIAYAVLMKSTVGMVAVICAIGAYYMITRKWRLLIIPGLVGAGILTFFLIKVDPLTQTVFAHPSPTVWKETLKLCMLKPIAGWGPGQFQIAYNVIDKRFLDMFPDVFFRYAHNDYVQILFETGLVGFGIFMGLIITTTRKFRPELAMAASGLVALGIAAAGGFPLHIAPFVLVGIVYLAVIDKGVMHGKRL